MIVQFDKSIEKSIDKIIDELEKVNSLKEVPNLRKLSGLKTYFRIILGDTG